MPSKYDHLPQELGELMRMYSALHDASPTKDPVAMAIFAATTFLERRHQERAEAEAERHAQQRAELMALIERLAPKKP